jgi:UDP-N-acetylmuramate--alanine ligase
MNAMNNKIGTLHFVGIGGIGMSGIAEILNSIGYKVQGSDIAESYNVKRLQDQGIRVLIGHEAAHIKDAKGDLPAAVVISSAVKKDNPEVEAARKAKVPVVRRAEMLAELMRLKRAFAVSGTHGKTTTTSLVGEMLEVAGFDPTVINGGIVNAYGTNTRLGQSEWMVVEADESDGTFTRLPATVAVITNIDPEHMDHYGDFESVKKAYRQFIYNLPFYGYAVLCIDHPVVQGLVSEITDRKVITYGFNPQADVKAFNIRPSMAGSVFDVKFAAWLNQGSEMTLKDVFLPVLGDHNVQNSLVALSIAQEMGVPAPIMKKCLENFKGVKRRFTRTGLVRDITIIDDYAHHPIEIETVLKAARTALVGTEGRVISIVQPHRFSRLHDLFDQFCTCFNDADSVIVADIYAAGEDPIEGADKDTLVKGIRAHGHRDVMPLPHRDDLAQIVADIARPGDFVICMGAGDITGWAYALPAQLESVLEKSASAA